MCDKHTMERSVCMLSHIQDQGIAIIQSGPNGHRD